MDIFRTGARFPLISPYHRAQDRDAGADFVLFEVPVTEDQGIGLALNDTARAGATVLREPLQAVQIVGCALVMLGVMLVALPAGRADRPDK